MQARVSLTLQGKGINNADESRQFSLHFTAVVTYRKL